jgi:CheY-like chemotaxis protein
MERWQFFLVEDNDQVRRDVVEYIEGEEFDFGAVAVQESGSFGHALDLLSQRKVDLLILDVMGNHDQDKTAGIGVLEKWKKTGFAPVIFYTALPESVRASENALVRVVGKEAGSLEQLGAEIKSVFDSGIPQAHKALVRHFDLTLRDYMWGFVLQNWPKFEEIVRQPDFVRLLLQRLAARFGREGVEQIVKELHPGYEVDCVDGQKVHPTEYYIVPPVGDDPQLGDLRRIGDATFVVVWPSCDLIRRNGVPKVEKALCAKARPLSDFAEFNEWLGKPSGKNAAALKALMKNNRGGQTQADRYHFLPGAWSIPPSIIDFQELVHFPVDELRECQCLAVVASPFAEAIGARFTRYLGRLGTPDLDIAMCLRDLVDEEGNGSS